MEPKKINIRLAAGLSAFTCFPGFRFCRPCAGSFQSPRTANKTRVAGCNRVTLQSLPDCTVQRRTPFENFCLKQMNNNKNKMK